MTSRRSIRTNAERTSRAFQFIPGHVGGRVASAQPVKRRQMVGTSEAPAALGPLYWYKFDESSGSVAVDSIGAGADLAFGDTGGETPALVPPYYEGVALTAGSVYSMGFGLSTVVTPGDYWATAEASFSTGLAAGADGKIVFDFWVAGMTDTAVSSIRLLNVGSNGRATWWIYRNASTGDIQFRTGLSTVLHTQSTWGASPTHIRWETSFPGGDATADGDSTVYWNGSQLGSTEVGAITWYGSEFPWAMAIEGIDNDDLSNITYFDELKVYGSQVSI